MEFVAESRKLADYLLNEEHPHGESKAVFFKCLGCTQENPERLGRDLIESARGGNQVEAVITSHGRKVVYVGSIRAPGGANRLVRTVWIQEGSDQVWRLVSAYPAGGKYGS